MSGGRTGPGPGETDKTRRARVRGHRGYLAGEVPAGRAVWLRPVSGDICEMLEFKGIIDVRRASKRGGSAGATNTTPTLTNPHPLSERGHVMAISQCTPTFRGIPLRVIERKVLDRVRRTPSGCWEWVGYRKPSGYGKFSLHRLGTHAAHRLAYEVFCGPIPEGLSVCHHCDNPPCCNPAHLFVGTNGDNIRDRNRKGRNPVAKLSDAQRESIRREYVPRSADFGIPALARKYGVGFGTIHRTLNFETH